MNPTRASEAIAVWLRGGSPAEPRNQTILARRLSPHVGRNVHQSTISGIAAGRRAPRAELMGALHVELGIAPEWWWEAATHTGRPASGGKEIFALREHPAAGLFPLASEAELRELADDIRSHGLRQPVVLIKEGSELRILDGRNRLLACELAGVAPTYLIWQGADPIAYVVSQNLRRRSLSTAQRATLGADIAALYGEAAKRRDEPPRLQDPSRRQRQARPPPGAEPVPRPPADGEAAAAGASSSTKTNVDRDAPIARDMSPATAPETQTPEPQ